MDDAATLADYISSGTLSQLSSAFIDVYSQRPGDFDNYLSLLGYDAAIFALKTVLRPEAAGQGIIQELSSAETLIGVTGRLRVDAEGEIKRRMSVLRVQGGDIIEVMSAGTVSGVTVDDQSQVPEKAEEQG